MEIGIIQLNMYQLSIVLLLVPLAVGVLAIPIPKPSTERIERLASWKEDDQNMWELSNKTEGDMVLRPEQNVSMDSSYKWKNSEIPYELAQGVFSDEQAKIIHKAVREFRTKSCLNVRQRINTDIDYVYVTAEKTGCWADVGRLGGKQTINLQIDGCLTHQIIIHEFLHAAGFHHQHSATNRDKYIHINWSNIKTGETHNFKTYDHDDIANFGTSYDYGSIMHYSEKAFSANGSSTIVPKNALWIGKLGTATEMSDIDIEKLNELYCDNEPDLLFVYVGIGVAVLLCLAIFIAIWRGEWDRGTELLSWLTYTLRITGRKQNDNSDNCDNE